MNYFYLDASALVKRYIVETGSPLINHLFATAPLHRLLALIIGIGEILSVLVRRRNSGVLSTSAYPLAVAQLRAETIDHPDWRSEPADSNLVRASLGLIEQYSINATDALVLRSALDTAALLRAGGDDLVLVASDARLISAAQAEGLQTFNPESGDQPTLDALIAA